LLFFFAQHTSKLKERRSDLNRQNEMREIKLKERAYTIGEEKKTNK
jgi:hypothetical protein